MKATALLEKQHRKVEAIFEALEKCDEEPTALLKELADNLAGHMAIEQDIFYPAVREIKPHLVEQSFEEHALAEVALKRLLKTPYNDAQFGARISVLKELFRNHIEDEEEELFPRVEKAVSAEELQALGTKMEQAFASAQGEGFDALVPQTLARTSADDALHWIASEAAESAASPDGSARAGR
jgi:iron-sulfur cluster repair protein YtfE (RIC family)